MDISREDRTILRDLARRVADTADLPVMARRREMWRRHNRLQPGRPLVLVFPEGAWRELLPEAALRCEGEAARKIERSLRMRLYYPVHFHDDTVIEREWIVGKVVRDSGWGLDIQHVPSSTTTGAWGFRPVIKTWKDLRKLRFPQVRYDARATAQSLEEAQSLFGDLLEVRLKGVSRISFHLMSLYCQLRGLEQVMWDMHDNPAMLQDAMAFLEEGNRRVVQQYVDLNLLSLNNDSTYHSSGGVGYTDELPTPGWNPDRVRPEDLWASAEAQEMAQVSPEMHERFILQYERRLLAPFALNGYGCCDDLTHKMDLVLRIPGIRRVSVSPWADVEACAVKLRGRAIFSWKPNPSLLVGTFDEERVRAYIQHTLDVTRGCVVEMILKDTHTCENHPDRFTRWTAIARELVEDL